MIDLTHSVSLALDRTCDQSRFLGLHAGLTEGFDGGEEACSAGRAAGDTILFDLKAVMSRQIAKVTASRETDQARLPRPLAF